MDQFEKMMNKITEYSDTTVDTATGEIVRDEKGRIVPYDEICVKR